jgi:hypothetical protein
VRLDQLVRDPGQQRKLKQQYDEDEERIERIVKLLPDAFLYEYAPCEDGNLCLNFRPNPSFHPQSIEARIFHAMQGTLWVNASTKHMVRLQGSLIEDLSFGFGILGHLNKGGWFELERVQVSPTDWKTNRLEVHMTGRQFSLRQSLKILRKFVPIFARSHGRLLSVRPKQSWIRSRHREASGGCLLLQFRRLPLLHIHDQQASMAAFTAVWSRCESRCELFLADLILIAV